MSSRARAVGFALGALACAALAAAAAGRYTAGSEERYGLLRSVVISAGELRRGVKLTPRVARDLLEVRQVPESFAPRDALADPAGATGSELALSLPAGSYLTAGSLRSPRDERGANTGVPANASPVEIAVTGAATLAASGRSSGPRVDVVVSGDSGPGPQTGRTYVAASAVRLLALRKGRAEPGLGADRWIATLALTRPEALRLIRAEGYARSIRLLTAR